MRLIDADAVSEQMRPYISLHKNSEDLFLAGCGDGAYHYQFAVDHAPTIEERKTGKWEVKLIRPIAHLLICSNCGAEINITEEAHLEYYKRDFRYCPHCGARMEVNKCGQ